MSVSTWAKRRRHNADDVVTEMTPAQYKRARDRALKSLAMTYSQLAEQAKTGRFSSVHAKKVWIAFGRYTGQ